MFHLLSLYCITLEFLLKPTVLLLSATLKVVDIRYVITLIIFDFFYTVLCVKRHREPANAFKLGVLTKVIWHLKGTGVGILIGRCTKHYLAKDQLHWLALMS